MKNIEKYADGFKNPNRRYAIYPILHQKSFDKETVDLVERRGFAGVVGNLKYTKNFPNDEKAWTDACDGFREYIKRGMHAWLYDEEEYPSGSARGYVPESNPDFVAKGLYCYHYWKVLKGPLDYRADVPADKLYRALLLPVDSGEIIDVTDTQNENGVLYFDIPEGRYTLLIMSIRRLFDGTHSTESWAEPRNYISLADKEATRAFIECTHENYKKRLGDEFGKGVLAMFTDEPSLTSWQITSGVFPILPWLNTFPADFEKRYGYDFKYACVAVLTEKGEDIVKRRCDFWEFIADEVADSYFKMIQDWCHENNLKASGHMLREETLQSHVYCYGSFYRAMKKFDWPGLDMLETDIEPLMSDKEIPVARFIASFADINGEHEVFTEFQDLWYQVSPDGKVAGIDCYYNSVNWHLAMGVNNFTSYYSFKGLTDKEIYDFNTYTARSGYLLRQGVRDSRVAFFYPEAAAWSAYTPTAKLDSYDDSERTVILDKTFAKGAWELLHRQIDFDYIDRDILINSTVKDGILIYRDRAYTTLVMPCARVLEEDAMKRLIEIANDGVTVMFLTEMPAVSRNSGKAHPLCDELKRLVDCGKMFFTPDVDGIGNFYDEKLPSSAHSIYLSNNNGTNCDRILSHCRTTDDCERVVYIANMSADSDFAGKLGIVGDAAEIYEASPITGEINKIEFLKKSGIDEVEVSVKPGEGRFYLVYYAF